MHISVMPHVGGWIATNEDDQEGMGRTMDEAIGNLVRTVYLIDEHVLVEYISAKELRPESIQYRGYEIARKWTSNGTPQPDEWVFSHNDYDGPEDNRCGYGTTKENCMRQIDALEAQ
jgi:hypothetical protein